MSPEFLIPNWPVANKVQARVSLRKAGVSQANFASFNLATHVGDNERQVMANRKRLIEQLDLESDRVIWGQQVHGTDVLTLPLAKTQAPIADGFYSCTVNQPCLVMTADCLPVFFASACGREVAVAHAGWRGLAAGVLEQTISCFRANPSDILVYLGPAIGPKAFQVGEDVYQAFRHLDTYQQAFQADQTKPGYFLADIYALARRVLQSAGIEASAIYGGTHCTFSEDDAFFSYRRDAKKHGDTVSDTGRMASVIWIQA